MIFRRRLLDQRCLHLCWFLVLQPQVLPRVTLLALLRQLRCARWSGNRFWQRLSKPDGTAARRLKFWASPHQHFIEDCGTTISNDDIRDPHFTKNSAARMMNVRAVSAS